ncbi:MAG: hypothetical protein IJS96_10720 [Schwartzia sp.]|nr:hypothetical protein [Schwartzia sp. (in: firmicutes)]
MIHELTAIGKTPGKKSKHKYLYFDFFQRVIHDGDEGRPYQRLRPVGGKGALPKLRGWKNRVAVFVRQTGQSSR